MRGLGSILKIFWLLRRWKAFVKSLSNGSDRIDLTAGNKSLNIVSYLLSVEVEKNKRTLVHYYCLIMEVYVSFVYIFWLGIERVFHLQEIDSNGDVEMDDADADKGDISSFAHRASSVHEVLRSFAILLLFE